MNKEEFLANIKQQFVDVDDLTFSYDMIFRDIDTYDSLTGMSILVMLQDQYDITIPESDYKGLTTFEDIFVYVKKRKQ